MNPFAMILAAARSSAHKSGVFSAAEAFPGSIAAYVAIRLSQKAGRPLSMEEVLGVYMAGPTISSYVLGTLRKVLLDTAIAIREIMTAFQRGTSNPDGKDQTNAK